MKTKAKSYNECQNQQEIGLIILFLKIGKLKKISVKSD